MTQADTKTENVMMISFTSIQNLFYNDSIIDPTQNQLTVCNNACWSLGEMAVSPINQDIIKPFTDEIV